jgi:hypothetical protein
MDIPRIGDNMFKFSDSFLSAVKGVLTEAAALDKHIETAYSWHGGGGSSLYQFASTGGKIHNEEHREKLKTEVKKNMDWCESRPETDEAKDLPKLKKLHSHISKAAVTPYEPKRS